MSEQGALVDLVQYIIEDSQDEPQFSTREHALMGAERIRDEYLAAHDRQVKAEALREAADRLHGATEGSNREGTAEWPTHCRDDYSLAIDEAQEVLLKIASNIESQETP